MTETPLRCVVFAGTSLSVREALEKIAAQRGIPMRAFRSVQDCRRLLAQETGTVLAAELDGDAARELQCLAELTQQYPLVRVVAIVDRSDIPTTVEAMRAGAVNCLEKPVDPELMTSAMDEALDQINPRPGNAVTQLTPVETTVLQHILQGRTNRQIAEALHRSPRTIEVHRRHIMRKLGVSTIVDLVKAAGLKGSA